MNKIDKAFYKIERENLWKKQNGCCYYCQKNISKNEATMDHVQPLKFVKHHIVSNCVVACESCNRKKGCRTKFKYVKFELDILREELQDRIKLAEYKLSFNTKGSFKKWKKYWTKQGRWN